MILSNPGKGRLIPILDFGTVGQKVALYKTPENVKPFDNPCSPKELDCYENGSIFTITEIVNGPDEYYHVVKSESTGKIHKLYGSLEEKAFIPYLYPLDKWNEFFN